MSAGRRPPLPLILSANDLLAGEVVYRAAGGWSTHLSDALAARDEEMAAALAGMLDEAERTGEVVGPTLVPVSLDKEGRIVPTEVRERIRALGPTIRQDLGPQGRGEHRHVSI